MQQTLTRWEPIREMEDFQNRLSTLFGRPLRRGNGREEITLPEWTPLADITEDEREYLIKAELPEMKKEDVKVTVENGVLTISGERKFEKEEKKRKYHRVERGYGTFMRSFALWRAQGACAQERTRQTQANRSQGRLSMRCDGIIERARVNDRRSGRARLEPIAIQ